MQRIRFFQCVEPLAAPDGAKAVAQLMDAQAVERPNVLLRFLANVSTGFESAWAASQDASGRYSGPGWELLAELAAGGGPSVAADALVALGELENVKIYRRELLWALSDSLRLAAPLGFEVLDSCFRKTRNLTSHVGRRLARCCVGSTLLLKGMEFDHAIVIDSGEFTLNDYYVAITRGAKSLTILAPHAVRSASFSTR